MTKKQAAAARRAMMMAFRVAGGPTRLARKITEISDRPLSKQAVSKWQDAGRVPIERVAEVEKVVRREYRKMNPVDRFDLRPDVFERQC